MGLRAFIQAAKIRLKINYFRFFQSLFLFLEVETFKGDPAPDLVKCLLEPLKI